MIGRLLGVPEDNPFTPAVRFILWANVVTFIVIFLLFIFEIFVHRAKFGWIKEIYTLLTIIKVREAKTIEAQEKTEQTLQKIVPLIESNPNPSGESKTNG